MKQAFATFRSASIFLALLGILQSSGSLWAETESKTVRISFDIEPVMVMKMTSENGVGAVRLGPISPGAEPPPQALEIKVITNTRPSYQIYHRLEGEVTNSDGTKFPHEKLLFMVTNGTKGGAGLFPSLTSVPEEETLIFRSRSEGGTDIFRVMYSVENSKLFEAGSYYGNIYFDLRTE